MGWVRLIGSLGNKEMSAQAGFDVAVSHQRSGSEQKPAGLLGVLLRSGKCTQGLLQLIKNKKNTKDHKKIGTEE